MRAEPHEDDLSTRFARGGPMGHCPQCSSDRLLAITNGFETNFSCQVCGSCWSVSFGRASRVDPLTCPGCAEQHHCRGRRLADEAFETVGAREHPGPGGPSPRPGHPLHTYDRGPWSAEL